MAVRIGQASKDEKRRYVNGSAGDQSGVEVYTCNWYSNNWKYLIRPKNSAVAEKIASTMEAACANNAIGYDQNQRNTLLKYAKEVNFNLSKITTRCETDCTALVSVCIIAAGGSESIMYGGGNLAYTGNLVSRCQSTGMFDVYTDRKYLNSANYVKRGDILMSSGHAIVVLGTGSYAASSLATSSPSASSSKLSVDGYWGCATTRAVQKALGTTQDGLVSGQDAGDLAKCNRGGLDSSSWQIGHGGSMMVRALQRKIGANPDGYFGVNTCKALQKYLGTTQDGVVSAKSSMVKELQRRLNDGKF